MQGENLLCYLYSSDLLFLIPGKSFDYRVKKKLEELELWHSKGIPWTMWVGGQWGQRVDLSSLKEIGLIVRVREREDNGGKVQVIAYLGEQCCFLLRPNEVI